MSLTPDQSQALRAHVRKKRVVDGLERWAKKLVYAPLQWSALLFQLLVPARRDRVCYMSQPDFSDNAYYMFRYLVAERAGLEHVWVVRDRRVRQRIEKQFSELCSRHGRRGHRLKIVPRRSFAAPLCVLRAGVLFHTHGTFGFHRFSWRRVVVNLWHGMPIKCIGRLNTITPNPFPTYANLHLASSDFFRYVIAQAFGVPAARVLTTGLPRCDVLKGHLPLRLERQDMLSQLGIDADKKLLLWMPTYRTEPRTPGADIRSFLDDLPEGFFAHIQQQCHQRNIQLLIKLHSYDLLNRTGIAQADQHTMVMRAEQFNQLDVPLYDLIACADGLMTDISSVLLDFLLTQRPAAVVGFDAQRYTRDVVFPPEQILLCQQVYSVQSSPEMQGFLDAVMAPEHGLDDANPARIFVEECSLYSSSEIAEACGL